ncbi:hypothetical protein SOVF_153310 isoform A [Spinacia oleracea]|nr:hypothetical protein SOVF_153310 isoform A [Spinacia oleracea]
MGRFCEGYDVLKFYIRTSGLSDGARLLMESENMKFIIVPLIKVDFLPFPIIFIANLVRDVAEAPWFCYCSRLLGCVFYRGCSETAVCY